MELLPQALLVTALLGAAYALMGLGLTFVVGVMKMINWAMGEFFVLGGYLAFFLLVGLVPPHGGKPTFTLVLERIPVLSGLLDPPGLGSSLWWVAVPIVMLLVFGLGVLVQRGLFAPMFHYAEARRYEYATVMSLALAVLMQNLAVVLNGPYLFSPDEYLPPIAVEQLGVNIDGSRVAAGIGAAVILVAFFIFVKTSTVGLAFLGTAQNRVGAQTAGIRLPVVDMVAFGIGVALAAAAGALLAPVTLVYPTGGTLTTMKGLEIIVIGGLGSLPGAIVAAFGLALVETMGSLYLDPAYQNLYGFIFLILFLMFRPQGLFGEKERVL